MACYLAQFYFRENKPEVINFSATSKPTLTVVFPPFVPSTLNLKLTTNENNELKLQCTGPSLDPVETYEKFIVKDENTFIVKVNKSFFVTPEAN